MRRKLVSLPLQPLSKCQRSKRGSLLLPAATEISMHHHQRQPLIQSEGAAFAQEVVMLLNEGGRGSSSSSSKGLSIYSIHSSKAWTEMTLQSIERGPLVDSRRIPLMLLELGNDEDCCEEKPEDVVDGEAEQETDDVFDWRTGWLKLNISWLRVRFIDVGSW